MHAIALSNQRESVMVWDKRTGEPLYNALVWQDGRAQDICDRVLPHKEEIRRVTGLEASPFFSAPKIAWILEKRAGGEKRGGVRARGVRHHGFLCIMGLDKRGKARVRCDQRQPHHAHGFIKASLG